MRILFYYRGAEQLGLEVLSAILKRDGHQVGLLFDPGADNTFYFEAPIFRLLNIEKRLIRQAIQFRPDLIAFSCLTNLYPYVKSIASKLRERINVPMIIGGVHPTTLPNKIMADGVFDYLCVGEADAALPELVRALVKGDDVTGIANIWGRNENGVFRNPIRPLLANLDQLPIPDKDLFYERGAFFRNLLLMTSRGCPYKCSFCVNNFYHAMKKPGEKIVRQQSVDYTIRQLKSYLKYKPISVDFQDDIFGLDHDWLEEFSDCYPREIGIPFLCNVHPSAVNKRHAQLLKKAGCGMAQMGVQSGDEQMRQSMHRHENNERVEESVALLKEQGIRVGVEFIFGYPNETREQMWRSVQMNQRLQPNHTSTFVFYPFPETEAQAQVEKLDLMDENHRRSVEEGLGSSHTSFQFDHPYANEALNLASLLPLFAKLPQWCLEGVLKRIYRRKNNWVIRSLGLASLPLMQPWQFKDRLLNYSHMYYRAFTTPSADPDVMKLSN